MASLLNTLCKPCYSSFFECSVIFFVENLRERIFTNTFFRANIDILKLFFFQYKTEFIRFSSPLNHKNRFHQLIIAGLVLPAYLYSRSIKSAIMIKFSQRWNILRGLRKHERYVASMGE